MERKIHWHNQIDTQANIDSKSLMTKSNKYSTKEETNKSILTRIATNRIKIRSLLQSSASKASLSCTTINKIRQKSSVLCDEEARKGVLISALASNHHLYMIMCFLFHFRSKIRIFCVYEAYLNSKKKIKSEY